MLGNYWLLIQTCFKPILNVDNFIQVTYWRTVLVYCSKLDQINRSRLLLYILSYQDHQSAHISSIIWFHTSAAYTYTI